MTLHIIWDVSPSIFMDFDLFRWYGLCWALGIFLGYRIMLNIYKVEGLPVADLDKLTTYAMLGAIIGARLGHILFYDPVYYLNHPIEILPIKTSPHLQFTGLAGLASHGGILGALLALGLYKRKTGHSYRWMLDRLMIAGAALGGCIRLGNFMNSEIIGTPSNLPWAVVFTSVDQIPRHPAQLYEALFYFIASMALYFLWKSERLHGRNGQLFGIGLILIFAQRFLVEFVKENQVLFEQHMTLNMGQILSIPLIFIGLWLALNNQNRPNSDKPNSSDMSMSL